MKSFFSTCLALSLLILAAIQVPASSQSLLPPCPEYMSTFEAEKFVIRYNAAEIKSPATIVDSSLGAYDDVARFFGGYPNVTTLEIASDHNELRLLTGLGDAPESYVASNWNEGLRGVVIIKAPAVLPDYRQVLTYHMARIAERNYLTTFRAPEWFQDGFATYVASGVTDEERQLAAEAAVSGEWMALGEMEGAFRNMTIYDADVPEYRQARAQARAFIDHFGKKYGNRSLLGILADFGLHGDLNRSFVDHTGLDPETLSQDLRDELGGVAATPVPSAPVDARGTVEGYLLYSTGEPAEGQTVGFMGDDTFINVTASPAGHYLASLDPGSYDVLLQGFPAQESVTIAPGEKASRNFSIAAGAVQVSPEKPASGISVQGLLLPALLVGINAIMAAAILFILRRNWH